MSEIPAPPAMNGAERGTYVKKPVRVRAHRVHDPHDRSGWPEWLLSAWGKGPVCGGVWVAYGELMVGTLEGALAASPDDWIIKGVKGEICPCKPDVFDMTYQPAWEGN